MRWPPQSPEDKLLTASTIHAFICCFAPICEPLTSWWAAKNANSCGALTFTFPACAVVNDVCALSGTAASAVFGAFYVLVETLQLAGANSAAMALLLSRCNLMLDVIVRIGKDVWETPEHAEIARHLTKFTGMLEVRDESPSHFMAL